MEPKTLRYAQEQALRETLRSNREEADSLSRLTGKAVKIKHHKTPAGTDLYLLEICNSPVSPYLSAEALELVLRGLHIATIAAVTLYRETTEKAGKR